MIVGDLYPDIMGGYSLVTKVDDYSAHIIREWCTAKYLRTQSICTEGMD